MLKKVLEGVPDMSKPGFLTLMGSGPTRRPTVTLWKKAHEIIRHLKLLGMIGKIQPRSGSEILKSPLPASRTAEVRNTCSTLYCE